MKIALFFIGLMVGGMLGVMTMCCFQLKRVNEYECEIGRLKEKSEKQK